MNILCFIDNLGSGGAQRQLVNLAIGFKNAGHDVHFLLYSEGDFYFPHLKQNNINVKKINSSNYLDRVLKCRKYIREGNFDVVLSFLETPSLIAEVSSFPFRKWRLIVGERSSDPRILSTFKGRFLRVMHLLADVVVSNSVMNSMMVKKANPLLSNKRNKVIYNLYDLDQLDPSLFCSTQKNDDKFHLLIAASHQYVKNLKNLVIAVSMLDEKLKNKLLIDWYGKEISPCYEENMNLIKNLGLYENFKFYKPILNIYEKMCEADAVGLFSEYEGLSNTICEAMCLGKVVITTDVSDNKLILGNSKLISIAKDPVSISKSITYLLGLSKEELNLQGASNRLKAVKLFDKNLIVNQYLSLMQ